MLQLKADPSLQEARLACSTIITGSQEKNTFAFGRLQKDFVASAAYQIRPNEKLC